MLKTGDVFLDLRAIWLIKHICPFVKVLCVFPKTTALHLFDTWLRVHM